jgi:hypothetical protein
MVKLICPESRWKKIFFTFHLKNKSTKDFLGVYSFQKIISRILCASRREALWYASRRNRFTTLAGNRIKQVKRFDSPQNQKNWRFLAFSHTNNDRIVKIPIALGFSRSADMVWAVESRKWKFEILKFLWHLFEFLLPCFAMIKCLRPFFC